MARNSLSHTMDEAADKTAYRALVVLLASVLGVAYVALLLALPDESLSAARIVDAVVFVVLAVIAEQMAVWVSDRISVTAGNLPLLLVIMFCGPLVAVPAAIAIGCWGAWRERTPYVAAFNCINMGLSALLSSLAYGAVLIGLGGDPEQLVAVLLAGAAAAAAYELSNIALTGLGMRLAYAMPFRRFWHSGIESLLQSMAVLSSVGLAIAAVYLKAGIVSVVLLFIPLFASQYMFKLLVREREHLAEEKKLSDQYLEMNIGLAAAMVVLLDSKDEYTASHSAAVAMYCRDMARAVGMPEAEIEEIHVAGLLHDLGKVGTPDAILGKAEALTEDEWDYIRQHPSTGAEVLSHLATYRNVADIVRSHHERLDGSGYPDGLPGEAIPEASKILAVADSYHAITSDRPYREARSSFEALKELRAVAGTMLESRYVETLAQVLRDKDLAYREGTSTDFMGEFERGRINLRLREESLAEFSAASPAQEEPTAT